MSSDFFFFFTPCEALLPSQVDVEPGIAQAVYHVSNICGEAEDSLSNRRQVVEDKPWTSLATR